MSFLPRFVHVQGMLKSVAAAAFVFGAVSTVSAQQPQAQPAQQPTGQQTAPQEANAPQNKDIKMIPSPGQSWTKLCSEEQGGLKTCLITRDFVMDNHTRGITLVVYDLETKPKATQHIRILVPLGFRLKPGVRLIVDKNKPFSGYYDVCLPSGCYVNIENANDLIVNMLAGKEANLIIKDATNSDINVNFSLEGFSDAFKGDPVDPKKLEEEREKLEKELIEKSEAMRRQLLGGTAGSGDKTSATPAAAQ